MRVAHICTRFNRISETFIYDLLLGLEGAGVDNHVLAGARVNAAARPFPRVTILRIPLWRQTAFAVRKRWLGLYRFPLPLRAARRALEAIRPGVVLAHFGGAGAAVAPVAAALGLPLVVVFHAFDLFMRHFRPATYSALWAAGARAVTVSEHGRRRLLELGCPEDRVRTIHCGVDAARFVPNSAPPPDGSALRLVSIGRLVEKKGFDDLLRAVAALRGRWAGPVRLDLWGDGPLKARLTALANRLGLRDDVAFRGAAASRDVPGILSRYDAFVLASRTACDGDTEGIPITILEAQAAGLPVVSTWHAGIPEAVPPANRSLLARERDADDLADKLAALASRPNLRRQFGLRGREWVLRHFSLDAEVAAYRRLFDEMAAASTSAPAARTDGGGV